MIPANVADATTHNAISRRAKERTCTCGATIIVGLDADRCAGEARVDPHPITAIGEVLALAAGRSTYTLRGLFRLELDHRTHWHITGASADQVTVVAAHVCGAPPLPTKPPTTTKELPDEPDY